MDDLPAAKTIDLCNNPMTKEPKIDAAKRIISEWASLDGRARELEEGFLQQRNKPQAPTHTEL